MLRQAHRGGREANRYLAYRCYYYYYYYYLCIIISIIIIIIIYTFEAAAKAGLLAEAEAWLARLGGEAELIDI